MGGPFVVVAGALANKPANGGEAWVRLSWIRGLERLGCRVAFVEEIDEQVCADAAGRPAGLAGSLNADWFETVSSDFGLAGRCSLLARSGGGLGWDRQAVADLAGEADLLVNISGNLTDPALLARFRRRAYVDIDPGFTQFWQAQGVGVRGLADHHLHFTIGTNIGTPACPIPTVDLEWHRMLPPVVLADWPAVGWPAAGWPGDGLPDDGLRTYGSGVRRRRFTTVATWRGPYGPVEWERRRLGLKVHEFRKFLDMPTAAPGAVFEAALAIHPSEEADLEQLTERGWNLADPRLEAGTPEAFRNYVAESDAEFSVAQEMYVATGSGWFSDRTTRYLASGRPALVQDTGFSRQLPVGKGLVTFSDPDGAAAGAAAIVEDYSSHAAAARALAEEYFDSDRVLTGFLEACALP